MQFWNNIIQTAMLGTNKKQVTAGELPEALSAATTVITGNTNIDKEEQFLQIASLAFNYRQSGAQPLHKEVDIPVAPAEEKPYCTPKAFQVLKDILEEESYTLLNGWLQLCSRKGQLVPPSLLPILLDKATQQKSLRTAVENCMGKRGEWLSAFNQSWNFTAAESEEDRWLTGKPEQRKEVLEQLRITNPALARQWIQETWAQENANSKAELLKAFHVNPDAKDVEWLESIMSEKSQKVKEEVMNILRQIPSSTIIQHYWQLVQESITLKKESAFLGLSTKNVLTIQVPAGINEAGIEKVSSQKEFTDEEFILYQLVGYIPPHCWEEYFKLSPADILQLFGRHKTSEKLIPAIVIATGRFKDLTWAPLFTGDKDRHYVSLLPLLSDTERDAYLLKNFEQMIDMVIPFLTQENTSEWKLPVARAVLKHTAANSYQYNRSFYNRYIHFIPVEIATELDSFLPTEPYQQHTWRTNAEYIRKLLQLKQRTTQSFS
jgi:hypothetical protein